MDWNGHIREFHQHGGRSSTPRVWRIRVDGNIITTEWGQQGGAMQVAKETHHGVNQGKKNEKSPAQYALERAAETVRKKLREGYVEWDSMSGEYVQEPVSSTIDFTKPLPESLCFWKPDNSLGPGMVKKVEQGKCWYTRKRNGMAFIIERMADGSVQLYSRRMLMHHDDEDVLCTWNERFPHLVDGAKALMPPRSILLGELVVDEKGKDRFDLVQSYTKSLTAQSKIDQATNGLKPWFYIWDIAFWKGEDLVSKVPVKDRYELIHELDYTVPYFYPIEVFFPHSPEFSSPDAALRWCLKRGWEGYVVVDPDGVFDDRAYNFKGKPDRPGMFAAKLKPAFEDDFIALWNPEKGQGERSTKGSRSGGIKSVSLHQYDAKGRLVFISNVSSGLTKEQLAEWANPKKFPMVWQVEYTGRRYIADGDDTNALDFPRFKMVRTDKKVEECINPRL